MAVCGLRKARLSSHKNVAPTKQLGISLATTTHREKPQGRLGRGRKDEPPRILPGLAPVICDIAAVFNLDASVNTTKKEGGALRKLRLQPHRQYQRHLPRMRRADMRRRP